MRNGLKVAVVVCLAILVAACDMALPSVRDEATPIVQLEAIQVPSPGVASLSTLCRERARAFRMRASLDAQLTPDASLSMGLVNFWANTRDSERKVARGLLEVFDVPWEVRRSADSCHWYDDHGEEFSLDYEDGISLADEIELLLRESVSELGDIGITQEDFRRTVLNDVKLRLVGLDDQMVAGYLIYRACRYGFTPLELGLESEKFDGCRYVGGSG